MSPSALLDFGFSLLLNAALLLSLVQIIDLAMARNRINWLSRPTWAIGLPTGILGILLINVSVTLMPGVVFDTRSVLLAICGLFLGTVPTLIAMAMTVAYRWSLGGTAVWTGIAVILASGAIGLLWRKTLRQPIQTIGWRQLYPLGLVTHAVMLGLMLLLPRETAIAVLGRISLPVMLIHPLLTVALGLLLAERLQHQYDLVALRDRERRYKRLFEDSPVAMGHAAHSGAILAQNTRFTELFGYPPEEIPTLAEWWPRAYPDPAYRNEVQSRWQDLLASAGEHDAALDMGEYRVTCKDGTERIVRITSMPVPEGLLAAFIDLTEIRHTEQALTEARRERQKALEMLGAVADATDDAIFAKDRDGRYLLFNRAAGGFVGQPTEAVLGRNDWALFPPEQASMLIASGEQAMRQERIVRQEEILDTAVGKRVFLATKGPLYDGEGRVIGLFGISRDITEQKRAERERQFAQENALQQQKQARLATLNQMEDANAARAKAEAALSALAASEAQLKLFIEHAPAALAMFDREMRYLAVSRRWLANFGLTGEGLLGRCHYDVFPALREDLKAVHRRALAGEVVRSDEDRFERADGSVLWLRWEIRPWHAADGRVGGVVIFSEDITERYRAEQERLELIGQLEKRNAELERFTYTVSHDLKSPLVTILGFTGQLEQDLRDQATESIDADLAFIRGAAGQMNELLDSLLHLSRAGRSLGELQPVALAELAHKAIAQLGDRLAHVRLEIDIPADLPVLMGDPLRLREVVQNLLENAVKFSREAVDPRIEIGCRHGDGEVVCFVRDNGIGVAAEYQEKIFGLFEQLDPGKEGTGIGLAIVRRVVEEHGGRVWVESAGKGCGSTFCFTLPV